MSIIIYSWWIKNFNGVQLWIDCEIQVTAINLECLSSVYRKGGFWLQFMQPWWRTPWNEFQTQLLSTISRWQDSQDSVCIFSGFETESMPGWRIKIQLEEKRTSQNQLRSQIKISNIKSWSLVDLPRKYKSNQSLELRCRTKKYKSNQI